MVSEQPKSRTDAAMGTQPGTGKPAQGMPSAGGQQPPQQRAGQGAPPSQSGVGTPSQSAGQQTQQKAGQVADQAKEQVAQVADQAKEQAGQVVDQAKEQVVSQVGSQKDRAVDSLGTIVDALRQTGQQLHKSDQHGIAQYAEKAADRVEQFTGNLKGKDVQTIVRDVERYARRQPALFLSGAFALGLLGARFLKSTGQREEEHDSPGGGYRPGQYGSYGRSGQYGQPGQYSASYSGRYDGADMGKRPGTSASQERSWSVRGTETR